MAAARAHRGLAAPPPGGSVAPLSALDADPDTAALPEESAPLPLSAAAKAGEGMRSFLRNVRISPHPRFCTHSDRPTLFSSDSLTCAFHPNAPDSIPQARAAVPSRFRRGTAASADTTTTTTTTAPPPAPPPRHIPIVELGETFGGVPSALCGALVALKAMETIRPEYHERLRQWATAEVGPPGLKAADGRSAEGYGKAFLVVGQEVRGQYMDYLRVSVEKAAAALRASCNVRALLKSLPADADPSAAFAPLLSAVRSASSELESGVGRSRVLVGLSRGLWDKAAAEVLLFLVDDCRENSSWRQRLHAGAAAEALGTEIAGRIRGALGGEGSSGGCCREEDVRPPEHARRVAALQSVSLSQSYSVY